MEFSASIKRLESAVCLNRRILNNQPCLTESEITQLKNDITQHTRAIEILKDNEI